MKTFYRLCRCCEENLVELEEEEKVILDADVIWRYSVCGICMNDMLRRKMRGEEVEDELIEIMELCGENDWERWMI